MGGEEEQMKKIVLFITTILCLAFYTTHVKADVGSFESYDSSGGSSSWSSSDSWSSSSDYDDWDSGSSYRSNYGSGTVNYGSLGVWVIIVAIIIYVILEKKTRNGRRMDYPVQPVIDYQQREKEVEAKIKQIDPLFSKEEFIASSKNLFIKLQQAWSARDWSVIRVFETNELFEQHKSQLQGYIDNNQINIMDRICVNYANLFAFRQEGDKDILVVRLNSRMADYIIDATSRQVIKGNKETEYVNTYLLTFVRKKGLQTKEGTDKINTTNCPNCGAPTTITSSGECEYCGSVITTGEYSWVLANLERERK